MKYSKMIWDAQRSIIIIIIALLSHPLCVQLNQGLFETVSKKYGTLWGFIAGLLNYCFDIGSLEFIDIWRKCVSEKSTENPLTSDVYNTGSGRDWNTMSTIPHKLHSTIFLLVCVVAMCTFALLNFFWCVVSPKLSS